MAVFGNRVITVDWGGIWLEASFKGDMWGHRWKTTRERCTKVRAVSASQG